MIFVISTYPIFRYFPEQEEPVEYKMGYLSVVVDCRFDKLAGLDEETER